MSPAAITARLAAMAELSRAAPARPNIDMSPTAISARVRELSELSTFCAKLARIGAANRAREHR